MNSIVQLNGISYSYSGRAWHAVSIERDSFVKVFRWVYDTFDGHGYSDVHDGVWLCWSDTSEIWFEHEKDAMLCVMKWT